jgi:hypothetical protein
MTTTTKQRQPQPKKYRSFIFVLHETNGILLLHCTRKLKKGYHYQIPGGHVDDDDFSTIVTATTTTPNLNIYRNDTTGNTNSSSNESQMLQMAGIVGAVRELYEETGIDLRTNIILSQQQQQQQQQIFNQNFTRIHPLPLYDCTYDGRDGTMKDSVDDGSPKHPKLINEYKRRLFYTVVVTDSDMIVETDHTDGNNNNNNNTTNTTAGPNHDPNSYANSSRHLPPPPPHIRLKLSHEHSGYTFVKNINEIYSMIVLHSGGAIAEAFRMACTIKAKNSNGTDPWVTTLCNLTTNPFEHLAPSKNISTNDGVREDKNQGHDDDDDDDSVDDTR